MRITKQRIKEIIREELELNMLRKRIRGLVIEISSIPTSAGAKKGGYVSSDTTSKESNYNTKKSTATTKQSTYTTKKAELDALASKKYRKSAGKGKYSYSAASKRGFSQNPDWTSKNTEVTSAESDRDTANSDRDSAKTTWDDAKEADLQKTIPTQKHQTGGGRAGAQFGKGKTAGKAGKKKK